MAAGAAATYVIVGAGHAGGRAARALREAGFSGRIVMVGAEPSLPYERPPLSKDLLTGAASPGQFAVNPPEFYDEARIELRPSAAVAALSPGEYRVVLADGSTVGYDRLLLATGARPRRLAVPGAELPGVHYLRTIEDSLAIRAKLLPGAHVAVIGGGLIGMEVAASARAVGARATVIEAAPRPMGRVLPPAVADAVAERHARQGVEIAVNCAVREIAPVGGDGLRVSCSAGDITADLAVVGIGIEPEVGLARAAGLAVEDGIVVDEFCESSAPGIYAAGDVACAFHPLAGRRVRQETWHNAQAQGQAAARSMCGQRVPYADVPYCWSQQFDMNLQIAGFLEAWDDSFLRGGYDRDGFVSLHLRQGRLVGAVALNRPRDLRIAQHLIARQTSLAGLALADESVSLKALLAAAA